MSATLKISGFVILGLALLGLVACAVCVYRGERALWVWCSSTSFLINAAIMAFYMLKQP